MQLGALRILFTAIFLLLIGWKSLKTIKKQEWKWILISGMLGTGIPVFLFAYAETEIDSGITAILNSSVPLLTFVVGLVFFGARFIKQQLLGVLIGLVGTIALILIGAGVNPDQNYYYALLVICATSLYAMNVNIIKRHMQNISAMAIGVGNFVFLIIPAVILLFTTGFFEQPITTDPNIYNSLGYIAILSIVGTGIAKVMFNKLNPVFASSVTYLMPIVSVSWGVLDDEKFTWMQFLATLVIISGVYIGNKASKKAKA